MVRLAVPLNYFDIDSVRHNWESLDFFNNIIENSESESYLASQQLSWDWSPTARKVLTKFRRLEGLFLTVDELREDLEKEWGQAPEGILAFQKELAGIYFETGKEGRIILGISQVASKTDFGLVDMPSEEFFFSNYDDWGFKYFLRHDIQVDSGDMIQYNHVKVCLENEIAHSMSRFFNSQMFSVYIDLDNSILSKSFETIISDILVNLGHSEIIECRDDLNWFCISQNGYAYKTMTWNRDNVLKFRIEIISKTEEEIEVFRRDIESIGFVLSNAHTIQEGQSKFWHYTTKEF